MKERRGKKIEGGRMRGIQTMQKGDIIQDKEKKEYNEDGRKNCKGQDKIIEKKTNKD